MARTTVIVIAAALRLSLTVAHAEDTQASIAAPTGMVVERLHAVGVQLYDCRTDGSGGLAWIFREPVATLMNKGKPVGRHFAGPSWELSDGSLVKGKEVGEAPGSLAGDISWLKLDVSERRTMGVLKNVTTVQRIATIGGKRTGPCPSDGELAAEPYEAEYVFSTP